MHFSDPLCSWNGHPEWKLCSFTAEFALPLSDTFYSLTHHQENEKGGAGLEVENQLAFCRLSELTPVP